MSFLRIFHKNFAILVMLNKLNYELNYIKIIILIISLYLKCMIILLHLLIFVKLQKLKLIFHYN